MKKLIIGSLFLSAALVASAASAKLAWNASTGATSYKLYVGKAAGVYTLTQPLGNVTSAEVTNLVVGIRYFFVVTAVAAGLESPPSNEVSYTPLPGTGPLPPAPGLTAIVNRGAGKAAIWFQYTNAVATSFKVYTNNVVAITTPRQSGYSMLIELPFVAPGVNYLIQATAVAASGTESIKGPTVNIFLPLPTALRTD